VPGRPIYLTPLGQSNNGGSVAIITNVSRAACDSCGAGGGGNLISVNFTSGGGTRGDGVLLALVDSTRQNPESTVFLGTGCGLRAVRPAWAFIVELDTYDDENDIACRNVPLDGSSYGFRLVRTYGPADEPVILSSVLHSDDAPSCRPSCTLDANLFSGNWWQLQLTLPSLASVDINVWAEGALRMSETNHSYVPSSFYLLAAGRTSTLSSDLNGVANMRVDCANDATLIGLPGAPAFTPDAYIGHDFAAAAEASQDDDPAYSRDALIAGLVVGVGGAIIIGVVVFVVVSKSSAAAASAASTAQAAPVEAAPAAPAAPAAEAPAGAEAAEEATRGELLAATESAV
jgi:hypothetical protein